jgi:hypothetical protein
MSKVTSRTLRHYDEIGLLRPAAVGSNGMRYYERDQLLRLQQIQLRESPPGGDLHGGERGRGPLEQRAITGG